MPNLRHLFTAAVAVAVTVTAARAEVRITEWMYSGSEFMEFTNLGPGAVDLTGWSYSDSARIAGQVDLSTLGTIAPGESFIIAEESDVDFRALWGLDASVKVFGGNTVNIGRGDEINLYDDTAALIDRLTYADNDTAGGPRTQDISGNIPFASLGLNSAPDAVLSSVGDAYGSYESLIDGYVANPGTYPIPEPASVALLALGGLVLARRRRAC